MNDVLDYRVLRYIFPLSNDSVFEILVKDEGQKCVF